MCTWASRGAVSGQRWKKQKQKTPPLLTPSSPISKYVFFRPRLDLTRVPLSRAAVFLRCRQSLFINCYKCNCTLSNAFSVSLGPSGKALGWSSTEKNLGSVQLSSDLISLSSKVVIYRHCLCDLCPSQQKRLHETWCRRHGTCRLFICPISNDPQMAGWFNRFNAEFSPKKYWHQGASKEMGDEEADYI